MQWLRPTIDFNSEYCISRYVPLNKLLLLCTTPISSSYQQKADLNFGFLLQIKWEFFPLFQLCHWAATLVISYVWSRHVGSIIDIRCTTGANCSFGNCKSKACSSLANDWKPPPPPPRQLKCDHGVVWLFSSKKGFNAVHD